MDQSILLCCKLFISESRNIGTLEAIEGAARQNPETAIVNKFEDRAYNRVRYTLVSYVMHDCTGSAVYSPLHQTVIDMAEAAYNAINLESHDGAHPRLGVVDDIVFHPLSRASLDEAAWLAKAVAADIGNRFNGNSTAKYSICTSIIFLLKDLLKFQFGFRILLCIFLFYVFSIDFNVVFELISSKLLITNVDVTIFVTHVSTNSFS